MRDFTDDLRALRKRLDEAAGYLKVDELSARRPQLETEASRPDLWDDAERARKVTGELSSVIDDLELHAGLASQLSDAETLYELAREEGDESLEPEIADAVDALARRFDEVELRSLLAADYAENDAVCEVKSGMGGTDAQDWAQMLLRMFLRWAERRGFGVEVISVSEGQEAGISQAEFLIRGRYAYGLLAAEQGVHRLVRISPFDNNARRQTSFASLHVTPFIEHGEEQIEIDEKDLRIDVYRSSGAGGQHVNVTDSAVRITHLPTGIVVSCQNERSQHQNKARAMEVLAAKLLEIQRLDREAELAAISGEKRDVNFGNQDVNYVLHPYQVVKDLRSGWETGNVDAVLDGDLDEQIEAYLRWKRAAATG